MICQALGYDAELASTVLMAAMHAGQLRCDTRVARGGGNDIYITTGLAPSEESAFDNAQLMELIESRRSPMMSALQASPRFEPELVAISGHDPNESGPPSVVGTEPGPSQSLFDALPLNGIAAMFLLDQDGEKNRETWTAYAHNAKRNGLDSARTSSGHGRRQSSFDPSLVGDWLVAKGRIDRARANRILKANLPSRSAHLKDLFVL